MQRVNPSAALPKSPEHRGPALGSVEKALTSTAAALGIAAGVQVLIYVLLIINRTVLLHPVIAGAALWLSRLASVAAIVAVIGCAVVLTRWLRARRAVAFARRRLPESRPDWALWAGCLVPLVNLAWAPVYVLELADREDQLTRLRKPIVVWWALWAAGTAAAVFATATSRAQDAQGIANNTVTMVVAYLLGVVTVMATARVVQGFERRSMRRPAHHWVVVADDLYRGAQTPGAPGAPAPPASPRAATPTVVLESDGQEPAA